MCAQVVGEPRGDPNTIGFFAAENGVDPSPDLRKCSSPCDPISVATERFQPFQLRKKGMGEPIRANRCIPVCYVLL